MNETDLVATAERSIRRGMTIVQVEIHDEMLSRVTDRDEFQRHVRRMVGNLGDQCMQLWDRNHPKENS